MALAWSELTYPQIRLLLRIDRPAWSFGRRIDDTHPGILIDELSPNEIDPMRRLLRAGLLQINLGWRKTIWLRLTDRGRLIRDVGKVP